MWPTLDGTAQPIVVHAAAAEELALVRGADGFMIAMLDASGDLQLARIAPSGITRSHASLGDIAVHQIAVTASYVLALRDDQTIAVIDSTGHEHGWIAMPARTRAIAIVTRNDHAIAIARYGKDQIVARPFDPVALTWGNAFPPIAHVSGARFALTPDGTRLAYETSTGPNVVVLASGATSNLGDTGIRSASSTIRRSPATRAIRSAGSRPARPMRSTRTPSLTPSSRRSVARSRSPATV